MLTLGERWKCVKTNQHNHHLAALQCLYHLKIGAKSIKLCAVMHVSHDQQLDTSNHEKG